MNAASAGQFEKYRLSMYCGGVGFGLAARSFPRAAFAIEIISADVLPIDLTGIGQHSAFTGVIQTRLQRFDDGR